MIGSVTHNEAYITIFIAAMLGGELLILPIILAAKMGYINLCETILVAFCGMLTKDWLVFLIFRKFGRVILRKHPSIMVKMDKVDRLFLNRSLSILYLYRLMFGLVNIIVITLGISKLALHRFARISLVSNVLLIFFLGSLGYFFTEVMVVVVDWIGEHELSVISGIVFLIFLYLYLRINWGRAEI